jgi:transposase
VLSRGTIYRIYAQGEEAVIRLITKLENRIEGLEAMHVSSPERRIASLSKELTRIKDQLSRQAEELLLERQQNHLLVDRIRELEQELEGGGSVTKDSHNSSLPPSTDPPWSKVKRTRGLRRKSGKKVGGQPGHKGSTLLQVAEPDEICIHRPEVCDSCGASLEGAAADGVIASPLRQVFDISEGRVKVTEHRVEISRCKSCGATTRARFPAGIRAPVQYGPGVLTRAIYFHLYQLIPVARTSETMRDLFGCGLSPATVERAGRICSRKLVRCEQRIKAAIRQSPVVGADETGLRVAGGSGWVHIARTETHTHYAYDQRRGKAAMDEIGILPGFRGTLVRDGFTSYRWYEQCRHALCNAHLLRDLVYIDEVDPTQKLWTEPLRLLLFSAKAKASESKSAGADQISVGERDSLLRRYKKILKQADRLNPQPPQEVPGPDPPVGRREARGPTPRSINSRLQRKRDEILRFMTDLSVPFDNNGSERDLRMVKLMQKIAGCFRTSDGARSFCRTRSYLSTARKQGFSLLLSLERVLNGKPLPVG